MITNRILGIINIIIKFVKYRGLYNFGFICQPGNECEPESKGTIDT